MFNKRAASSAVVLGLVLVVVLVVIIYFAASGNLGSLLGHTSNSTTTPTAFTTTAALQTSPILAGHSSNIIFTYFNPFGQSLTPNVTLDVGNPSYVKVTNPSILVSMPAIMSAPASGEFNVTCLAGNQVSDSTFTVSLQNFWQNATTSVETYPYGSTPLQVLPLNVSAGFLSVIANPITIETQVSSGNAQAPLSLTLSPSVYNGQPFVSTSKGMITKLILTISNTSGGIASAFVTYNLQKLSFTGSSTLTLTINDVNLALLTGGLPIEVTATNIAKPTQNEVGISTYYNYGYSFSGPTITCQ